MHASRHSNNKNNSNNNNNNSNNSYWLDTDILFVEVRVEHIECFHCSGTTLLAAEDEVHPLMQARRDVLTLQGLEVTGDKKGLDKHTHTQYIRTIHILAPLYIAYSELWLLFWNSQPPLSAS